MSKRKTQARGSVPADELHEMPPPPEGDPAPTHGQMDEPLPEVLTTAQMLARFVQIVTGNVVLDTQTGAKMAFKDFQKAYAHCQQGAGKHAEYCTYLWSESARRKQVYAITFDPAYGQIFRDAKGLWHFNIWDPPVWPEADVALARPFLEHIEYLMPEVESREFFYDWLAHCVQKPAERPHSHVAHISKETGTGRGWLGELMALLWGKHCENEVDLACLLDPRDQFRTSGLSGKVMVVCPEVKVPPEERYSLKERMRSFFTAPSFKINEKHEKRWTEKACARVFMASNNEDALPINESERRIFAIRGPTVFKPDAYYRSLYGRLKDPQFLAAVWHWLAKRDITDARTDGRPAFNLGKRPPLNEMKRAMIQAGRTEEQRKALELVRACPHAVISSTDLMLIAAPRDFQERSFKDEGTKLVAIETTVQRTARTRPIELLLMECGYSTYCDTIKFKGQQRRMWILKEPEKWANATKTQVRDEAMKARRDFERAGYCEDADCHQVLADVLELWEPEPTDGPPGTPPRGKGSETPKALPSTLPSDTRAESTACGAEAAVGRGSGPANSFSQKQGGMAKPTAATTASIPPLPTTATAASYEDSGEEAGVRPVVTEAYAPTPESEALRQMIEARDRRIAADQAAKASRRRT